MVGIVRGEACGIVGNLHNDVWNAYREWYQLQCFIDSLESASEILYS